MSFNLFKNIDYINIINELECSIDKIIIKTVLDKSNIDKNYLVYQDYRNITNMCKIQFYINLMDFDYIMQKMQYNTDINKMILEKIDSFNDLKKLNERIENFSKTVLIISINTLRLKVYNLKSKEIMDSINKQVLGQIIMTQMQYRNLKESYISEVLEPQYIYKNNISRCVYNIIDNSVTKQMHILLNNILAKVNYSKEDRNTVYMVYEEIDSIRNLILQKYEYLYDTNVFLGDYPDDIFYNTAISIVQFMKYRIDTRLLYYGIDYNLNNMLEFKEACGTFITEFELEFSELKDYICTENIIDDDY